MRRPAGIPQNRGPGRSRRRRTIWFVAAIPRRERQHLPTLANRPGSISGPTQGSVAHLVADPWVGEPDTAPTSSASAVGPRISDSRVSLAPNRRTDLPQRRAAYVPHRPRAWGRSWGHRPRTFVTSPLRASVSAPRQPRLTRGAYDRHAEASLPPVRLRQHQPVRKRAASPGSQVPSAR